MSFHSRFKFQLHGNKDRSKKNVTPKINMFSPKCNMLCDSKFWSTKDDNLLINGMEAVLIHKTLA